MAELISITPEVYNSILVVQTGINFGYKDLRGKAEAGDFQPNPPIILARIPITYPDWYEFFVYNGNSRYSIAREFQLPLNGLVINDPEEIPEVERLRHFPEGPLGVLRDGIIGKLWFRNNKPDNIANIALQDLIQQFYQQTLPERELKLKAT